MRKTAKTGLCAVPLSLHSSIRARAHSGTPTVRRSNPCRKRSQLAGLPNQTGCGRSSNFHHSRARSAAPRYRSRLVDLFKAHQKRVVEPFHCSRARQFCLLRQVLAHRFAKTKRKRGGRAIFITCVRVYPACRDRSRIAGLPEHTGNTRSSPLHHPRTRPVRPPQQGPARRFAQCKSEACRRAHFIFHVRIHPPAVAGTGSPICRSILETRGGPFPSFTCTFVPPAATGAVSPVCQNKSEACGGAIFIVQEPAHPARRDRNRIASLPKVNQKHADEPFHHPRTCSSRVPPSLAICHVPIYHACRFVKVKRQRAAERFHHSRACSFACRDKSRLTSLPKQIGSGQSSQSIIQVPVQPLTDIRTCLISKK